MMLDGLSIQKTDLGGVGLLAHQHTDTSQLRLVAQHGNQAGVGKKNERLVGAPP